MTTSIYKNNVEFEIRKLKTSKQEQVNRKTADNRTSKWLDSWKTKLILIEKQKKKLKRFSATCSELNRFFKGK